MSGKTVTGCINAAELIENTDPRFGALRNYLPAALVQFGKEPRGLLFSKHQVQEAGERWDANPEDQLPFEPEEVRIDRAVAIARKDERARVLASMQAERKAALSRAKAIGFLVGVLFAMASVSVTTAVLL
jgi:hypothetical protein